MFKSKIFIHLYSVVFFFYLFIISFFFFFCLLKIVLQVLAFYLDIKITISCAKRLNSGRNSSEELRGFQCECVRRQPPRASGAGGLPARFPPTPRARGSLARSRRDRFGQQEHFEQQLKPKMAVDWQWGGGDLLPGRRRGARPGFSRWPFSIGGELIPEKRAIRERKPRRQRAEGRRRPPA